jgi:hypothetical protein
MLSLMTGRAFTSDDDGSQRASAYPGLRRAIRALANQRRLLILEWLADTDSASRNGARSTIASPQPCWSSAPTRAACGADVESAS